MIDSLKRKKERTRNFNISKCSQVVRDGIIFVIRLVMKISIDLHVSKVPDNFCYSEVTETMYWVDF